MTRLTLLPFLLALPIAASAQIPTTEYQQRRAQLAAAMPANAAIVVLGALEPAHDYLEFYQHPTMLYLTGIREPNAALVMVRRGTDVQHVVFVQPRDPAVEVWSGRRIGPEGASTISGAPARTRDVLGAVLDSLAATGLAFHVGGDIGTLSGDSPLTPLGQYLLAFRDRHQGIRLVADVNRQAERLRGTKSPAELALIRRAIEITMDAHRRAFREMAPGRHEYEIEASIEHEFRRQGAERPSFASIIGSGPNATVLHYNVNDRQIQAGDMVVMDIGASYMGYAADVTRSVPATGTFTAEQRAIYQIVRDAQAAAERNAKPGMPSQGMADSASAVLAAGLARLGLIESPTATYDVIGRDGNIREARQLSLYYMHGLGHGIGLEVHDPEQFYFTDTIGVGSAFTIEPGLYVREDLLETLADTPRNRALIAKLRPVVQRYRNIGVRIEDDYIVTEQGLEWVSRVPREIAEIEAAMRGRR